MAHVHDLTMYEKNVEGFHTKRDDGQTVDVRWYVGDVYRCQLCQTLIFRAPGRTPVEVEHATDEEVAEARRLDSAA